MNRIEIEESIIKETQVLERFKHFKKEWSNIVNISMLIENQEKVLSILQWQLEDAIWEVKLKTNAILNEK